MSNKPFLERLRKIEKLTPSETKVVSYLERKYPNLAYETITSISKGADVGNATVGRLVTKLDYKSFSDFISQIRSELSMHFVSPIDRFIASKDSLTEETAFARHISYATKNMIETKALISNNDIKEAAAIFTKPSGTLYVTGGASAQTLAKYFSLFSKYVRGNVVYLEPDLSTLAHKLADVSPDDTLFSIAHKRYSNPTSKIAQWFHDSGSKVVSITDSETSPLAKISDIYFIVRTAGPAMFNSRVVTLLLIETLIEEMILLCEEKVTSRFKTFEELFEKFDTYCQDT